ncbi:MAG: anaerobic ribonucleoside-triphosphate reductase activating protein [Spirochaetes bacterium GWB1_59_5]|nr:MAG: anaerobic ribonucleoside-triphosphate reductase activating protein [Spirochaetes bacterium GWB1_59_5]
MRLGIQKTSLVDYPGRVSAVLFAAGCALRCPYCHNPELVEPSGSQAAVLVSVDEALAFLQRRRDVLTGVVLSGGEPTLHAGLPELAQSIRALGLNVKLDTNGTLPERIVPVGADYIAMDLKTSPERYSELWPGAPDDAADRIRSSVIAVRQSGAEYEFRITCAPGIFAEADAKAVAALLAPEDPVFLQRYRPGRVLDPAWDSGIFPYTEERLAGLLAIIRNVAPTARIRGF